MVVASARPRTPMSAWKMLFKMTLATTMPAETYMVVRVSCMAWKVRLSRSRRPKPKHADDVKEEHARGDGGAFKVKLPAQVQRLDDVLVAYGADGDDGRHHHGDGHGGAAHDPQNAAAVVLRHHAAHAREHDRRQRHDDYAGEQCDDLVAVGERGHVAGVAVGGAPLIDHVVEFAHGHGQHRRPRQRQQMAEAPVAEVDDQAVVEPAAHERHQHQRLQYVGGEHAPGQRPHAVRAARTAPRRG